MTNTISVDALIATVAKEIGDPELGIESWYPDVLALRLSWPDKTATLGYRTQKLRRLMRRCGYQECYFSPTLAQPSVLVVFDRNGAWDRAVAERALEGMERGE